MLLTLAALTTMPIFAQEAGFDEEVLSDPTAPLNYTAPSAAASGSFFDGLVTVNSYKLNSVLIRAQDRIAIINELRVRVGDSVGKAKVMKIESGSVEIKVDGETRVLQLYENTVKTLAAGEGK